MASSKSPAPSTILLKLSFISFTRSLISSALLKSSVFTSFNKSFITTVIVISILKSKTSASTSTYSGISMSSTLSLYSPSTSLNKLSLNPGNAKPPTTVLVPSLITRPLVTVTLENFSFSRIVPVNTTNGTDTCSFFPFTSTSFFSVFV